VAVAVAVAVVAVAVAAAKPQAFLNPTATLSRTGLPARERVRSALSASTNDRRKPAAGVIKAWPAGAVPPDRRRP
jgi:hypothetical protein